MTKNRIHVSPTLSLPIDFVTATDGVFATKGMGKSHLAQVCAEELLELGHVVVVIDPTDAWWGLRSSADGKDAGYPIVVIGGDHGDMKLEPDGAVTLAESVVTERFSCIICTDGLSDSAELKFVRVFLDTLYRKNREPIHVFVDEADIFAPQKPFEVEDSRCIRAMSHIVRRGRKKGIGSTVITQRPSELNASVRSMVDTLFVLGMSHHLDIDAVERWLRLKKKKSGGNAAAVALQEEMIESLDTLPQGDAWCWSPRQKIHQRFRAREKRTFDSGATPKVGQKLRVAKKLAPVDIARLGAAIAAQVERQKAEDPRALRARVAELEAQLKKGAPMPKKVNEHVVEKPIVSKAMVVAFERSLDRGDKSIDKAATLADKAGDMMKTAAELMAASGLRIEAELAKLRALIQGAVIEVPKSPPKQVKPAPSTAQVVHPWVSVTKPAPVVDGNRALSTIELRILEACAWAHAIGLDAPAQEVVAFLAGYTVSGHFANMRGKMRTAGLIEYPGPGTIRLTDAGRTVAPTVSRPLTNDELHRAVLDRLDPAKRRILAPLIDVWPDALRAEDAAKRAGFEVSGHFANMRGRLRTMGLITYPRDGEIRAADLLFPEMS